MRLVAERALLDLRKPAHVGLGLFAGIFLGGIAVGRLAMFVMAVCAGIVSMRGMAVVGVIMRRMSDMLGSRPARASEEGQEDQPP